VCVCVCVCVCVWLGKLEFSLINLELMTYKINNLLILKVTYKLKINL